MEVAVGAAGVGAIVRKPCVKGKRQTIKRNRNSRENLRYRLSVYTRVRAAAADQTYGLLSAALTAFSSVSCTVGMFFGAASHGTPFRCMQLQYGDQRP